MINNRRFFLKSTILGIGLALLKPLKLLAEWPAERFSANDIKTALGGDVGEASTNINIKTPDIAENGAVVPVSVETDLPNVESIAILVKENQRPLAAMFILGPGVQPNIATRIKMSKTSDVITVVKSANKNFTAKKEVKVTIGGCGG